MKNTLLKLQLLTLLFLCVLSTGFSTELKADKSKEECLACSGNPTVSNTTSSASITSTTATLGGDVTGDGSGSPCSITENGIYWSTTSGDPANQLGTKVMDASPGLGAFTVPVTGLPPGTTIYFVSYAINNVGGFDASTENSFTTTASATIANATGGVNATLVASQNDQGIIGFNFTTSGGQNVTGAVFTFSMDTAVLKLKDFQLVESNDATFDAGDAVIAQHSDGKLVGTSSTIITVSGISAVSTKWYFLRADVDATATSNTFNIQLTSATISSGIISNSSPYFTNSGVTISPITATFSQAATGVSDPVIGGDMDKGLIGFNFTTNLGQTVTGAVFTFSMDTATLGLENFQLVESADATFDAGDAIIAQHSDGKLVGTSSTVITVSGISASASMYYFLRADVDIAAATNTFNLAFTSATVSAGTVSNSSPYFTKSSIDVTALQVTLSQQTAGTSDPIAGNDTDKALIGFSFTTPASQTITGAVFTFSMDTATLKLKDFELWESDNADFSLGSHTMVASHSNGKLVGTSSTVLTISGIAAGPSTSNKYYFLIADVDPTATANTFNLQFTSATVSTGTISNSAPYFTKSNIDIQALTATIVQRALGTSDPLIGNQSDKAIIGFSFTSTGTQNITGGVFTFNTDTATLKLKNFELWESDDADFSLGSYTVVATHANGKLVGTSSTVLTISGITAGPSTDNKYYFLIADVDHTAPTSVFTLQFTSASVSAGTITTAAPYFTKSNIDITALVATLGDLNISGTNGVVAVSMTGGQTNQPIFGFSMSTTGAQDVSLIKINFDADPALYYTNYVLVRSSNANADGTGNAVVGLTSANVSGTGPWVLTIDPSLDITLGTNPNFFLFADVIPGVVNGTDAIQATMTAADITILGNVGSKTGSATGIDYDFVGLTSTLTELTGGISPGATALVAGTGGTLSTSTNAILGFSLQSNGSQNVNAVKIAFDSNPTGKFTAIGLRTSTDATFDAGDALVTTTGGGTVTGSGPYYITLTITTPISISTLKNFFIVASINGNANSTTASITPSLSSADVTLNPANIDANSFSGETYSFAASSASDIDFVDASSTSPILFATYSANTAAVGTTLTTANSTVLGQFTLRDGGASNNDSDTQKTSITSLTFTISNAGDLNTVAIFNGNAASNTNLGQQTASGDMTFTVGVLPTDLSDSITAADNGNQIFTIRATFNPATGQSWDNNPHQVDIYQATTATTSAFSVNTGSSLSASGLTTSETGSGDNNITVVGTKLIFNTIPAETNPSPITFQAIVHSTDANDNIEKDETDPITMDKTVGTGTLTGTGTVGDGTPTISPSSGVYTFPNLKLSLAGSYTLRVNDPNGATNGDLTLATVSIEVKSLGPEITAADGDFCKVAGNYFAQLDSLVLAESDPADFNAGTDKTFLLILPNGYEYLTPTTTSPTPVYSAPNISFTTAFGANLSAASFTGFIGNTIARFKWTVAAGGDEYDTLKIKGLYVRNTSAATTDSLLRSGTAIIEGIDETTNLGTLTLDTGTGVATFDVAAQPGESFVAAATTEFSFSSANPVILNGYLNGVYFEPDTITFSGNGVALKQFGVNTDRYVFDAGLTVPGTVDITMAYTDQSTGCITELTKAFTVIDQAITGVNETVCSNDETVYPLTVSPSFIPPGWSVDATSPFKYYDPSFAVNTSVNKAQYKLYKGGLPPVMPTVKQITDITFNPINPSTGSTFYPYIYDYDCYYGCYSIAGSITNPIVGARLWSYTSYIQVTIPNHGMVPGDKFLVYGNLGTSIAANYLEAATFINYNNSFTVTQYVDANNVIINAAESFTGNAYQDIGRLFIQINRPAPYNVAVYPHYAVDTQIDLTIPGHTFSNGDQVYFGDYYAIYVFSLSPGVRNQPFTVNVLDANTIRVNVSEGPGSPTNILVNTLYYNNYDLPLSVYFNPYISLPGNYFDGSVGFPYKGAARGTTQKNEFLATNFINSWSSTSGVKLVDFLLTNDGKRIIRHQQKVEFLNPPVASFSGLSPIPDYCLNSAVINLASSNPSEDGTYTVIPNYGITDGSNGTGTFNPSTTGVKQDTLTTITYTVTDANNCTNSSTQTLTVHSYPTADAGADVAVCSGTPAQIGAFPAATGNSINYTYSFDYVWTPNTGLVDAQNNPSTNNLIENPYVNPGTNQLYTLTITDNFGCSDTDQVGVTISSPPTANAGTIPAICSDEEVDLTTIGAGFTAPADSAGWTAPGGGVFKDGSGDTISVAYFKYGVAASYIPSAADLTQSGGFILTLTTNDPNGPCPSATSNASVSVNQDPGLPSVNFISPICVGGTAPSLVATPPPNTTITWYKDAALTLSHLSGSNVPSGISTSQDSIYYFYAAAEDINTNCVGNGAQATITVNPTPVVTFTAQNFCKGDSTQFQSTSTLPWANISSSISKYVWDFKSYGTLSGIGSIPSGDIAKGTYDSPSIKITNINTTYDVTLTVITDLGCANDSAFSQLDFTPLFPNGTPMRIGDTPIAKFTYSNICEGDITQFTDASTSADPLTFAWDFGDGNFASLQNPTHSYAGFGSYNVLLTATTNLSCEDDTVIVVPILPFINSFPYNATFDSLSLGNEGFATNAIASEVPGRTSWQYGDPSVVTGASTKAWFVYDNTIFTYNKNERSVLYAPCVDLTLLDRPVLSFDYYNDLDPSQDGIYVEWDDPTTPQTWQVLGGLNSGKNWYNRGLIKGLTQAGSPPNQIGQAVGQIGWSDSTRVWTTARHALDDQKFSKVMFRIVFGSNDDSQTNKGYAIDNFRLSSRNRQVLTEHFTVDRDADAVILNSNKKFNAFKANLTGSEIVKIQYHTNLWPGFTDPINTTNQADPNARVAFYGITNTSIPRVYIDGISEGSFTAPQQGKWTETSFNAQTLEDSKFELYVKAIPSADPLAITIVDSLVALEPISAAEGKLILHTLIVEKDIDSDSMVVRKMLPNAAGKLLQLPMADGSFMRDTISWQVDITNLGLNDLALVAFVQNQETKEVYQAAVNLTVTDYPASVTESESPDYVNKITFYPNPANQGVNIVLPYEVTKTTPVIMLDAYGKVAYENYFSPGQKQKLVNTADMAAGMYILQITTPNGGVANKKIMVVH